MPRFLFFLSITFSCLSLLPAQNTNKHSPVKWLYSMEEYEKLDSPTRAQKPIYMDLYTDWCGWCKVMDKQTFSNDSVAYYLNTYFIPIKLNAETRENIRWRDTKFPYNEDYNINSFALFLTSGQPGFPTSVIIDTDNKFEAIAGFLQVKDIERVIKFYVLPKEKRNFALFNSSFKSTWR